MLGFRDQISRGLGGYEMCVYMWGCWLWVWDAWGQAQVQQWMVEAFAVQRFLPSLCGSMCAAVSGGTGGMSCICGDRCFLVLWRLK